MDIVERLNDAINRFYGKEPAGLLQEAKDDLEWLNKKHAELIDDNERLRQQNAELVEALQLFTQLTVGNEILEKLESKDSVFVQLIKHARKVLAKATGGE